jgi:hypothetical protein
LNVLLEPFFDDQISLISMKAYLQRSTSPDFPNVKKNPALGKRKIMTRPTNSQIKV